MEKKQRIIWIVLIAIAAAAIVGLCVFAAARIAAHREPDDTHAFPVYINEILTSNGNLPNADGICCDYIELYNSADEPVMLADYALGDDSGARYTFPQDAVIAPKGYLVIYCARDHAGPNYAGFGLSKNGGELVHFYSPQFVVLDTVTTLAAGRDVAQGLDDTKTWRLLPFATPGYANSTEGFQKQLQQQVFTAPKAVRINEIMAANTIYRTVGDACTDWIELYNYSGETVDLSGYALSDDPAERAYTFPKGTVLEADGYLVVPCAQSIADAAHFGLSKKGGETVILFAADGTVCDTVATEPTEQNQSYMRDADGSWFETFDATPGYPNTLEGRRAFVQSIGITDADVHITELMADNKSILADRSGAFRDWIELSNTGSEDVTLSGWYLSNDADDLFQWQLPDCTIAAGQAIVVFFAGNVDGEIDGELFAPMKLSAAGGTLYLVDPIGEVREEIVFGATDENRSLAIDPQTGAQTAANYPTPGYPNTTEGYAAFSETQTPRGALAIWEVMTANDCYLPQSGEYFDWVELKNVSAEPVNLGAYSLTDDSKRPGRFALPDVTLAPGALYIVILSGHSEYSNKHYLHADFALNAQEDNLFLFENGALADYVHLLNIPYRESCGRNNGAGGFFYMPATPEKENEQGFRTVSADPVASVEPGVIAAAAGVDVALSANGTIYYTTDCSDPDRSATLYTGPIHLDHTTVIRAVSYEPEQKESPIKTFSYLINEQHDLPVVSLVTDPDHLWDSKTGIYVDPIHRKYIEYPASVAYFGSDGTWAKECGIKMHGATSLRDEEKKSFTVKFSGVYGGPLHYDVFGDGEVNTFKSVILRADAESIGASFIRDNMLHRIAKLYSPSMLAQNCKYVILYLNGEYWGIYAIREQYTEFFYASNMGVPEDTVTVEKNHIRSGTGLYDVLRYAQSHDMTDPQVYAHVAEQLDVMSFIDWAIFEAYSGNFDTSGNMRFLYSTADGKWRCGLVDIDLGFFRKDAFSYPLNAEGVGTLLRRLSRNATFRDLLLRRTAELLSTGLSDAAVLTMIDGMAGEIRSELPREKARWGIPHNWENMVAKLKEYIDGRSAQVIKSLRKELNVTDEEMQQYFGGM